ncbi:MAG TPA: hypothetical protein PLZ32_02540, partial [Saprospiraceae bacterium]|nr:hypothetical protein [Saprospiraceae bacterium]
THSSFSYFFRLFSSELLLVLNTGCISINRNSIMQENKMIISFQDFFENDTVTCKFNDCLILDSKILNSRKDVGNTGLTLTISKGKVLLNNTSLDINCLTDIKNENFVTILLNGHEETFKIDLSKGVYIGFDKKDKHLYIIQSKTPFEYD